MKIPLSLIRSFIDVPISPAEIADTLTLLGIEVDAIEDAIEDKVFEISLTPNLGHCMSALGIARELSAALQKPMRALSVPKYTESSHQEIIVAPPPPALCARYMSRSIANVSIGPSPDWLQKQLLSCGMTPICNAVDITNYILLKFGQPMHVFDADALHGTLSIEPTLSPQKFLGLDQIEREVPAGSIAILNHKKEMAALAGILGGKASSVSSHTKNLLLEAAVFDAGKIRASSKKMGLRTESSQRFEKGVDPVGTEAAFHEALSLLLELCKGTLGKGTDWKQGHFLPKQIPFRPSRANQLLGTRLSMTEMEEIFQRLHFQTETKDQTLLVSVPLFRSDIAEEIDLVEEIARIYGYNHIEKPTPKSIASSLPHDPTYLFEKEIRKHCIALGLQEWLNSDLISKTLAQSAIEWMRPGAAPLQVTHAKTEEYSVLRPSLLPGVLQTAKMNFNQKNFALEAFEIGRIHFLQNDELVEEPMAALLLSGKNRPPHWSQRAEEFDFFDLKGHIESLFTALHVPLCTFTPSQHLTFHPVRQADLFLNDLRIGSLGEIHPMILSQFEIKQKIFYAEINMHHMQQQMRTHSKMFPLAQFPASERDWTIEIPSSLLIQTVFDAIHSTKAPLLEKVELVDLYLPDDKSKKCATFRFTYRDLLKTISFEEVDASHTKLIRSVEEFLAK